MGNSLCCLGSEEDTTSGGSADRQNRESTTLGNVSSVTSGGQAASSSKDNTGIAKTVSVDVTRTQSNAKEVDKARSSFVAPQEWQKK